jgi:hypothetical protein
VLKVVLYVCVLVSSMTIVFVGSAGKDGIGERRIGSNGDWGGEGGTGVCSEI